MTHPKDYEKVKWKYLGKYYVPQQCFKNVINTFRCPICRSELIVSHRGRLYKIECYKCQYERIGDEIANESIKIDFSLLQ